MKLLPFAVVSLVTVACSDDAAPARNPARLWLAPGDSEVQVRLAAAEPPPY